MDGTNEAVELISAYRAARYHVRLPGGRRVALRVGSDCPRALAEMIACEESRRLDHRMESIFAPGGA